MISAEDLSPQVTRSWSPTQFFFFKCYQWPKSFPLLFGVHLPLQTFFRLCPQCRTSGLDGKGCQMPWFEGDNPSVHGPPAQFKISLRMLSFLKSRLFFYSSFWFTTKLSGGYNFLYTSCPNAPAASPSINAPHQSDTFVTLDGPAMTYHYHSKSVFHIRVHSCCCTVYGFGKMDSDTHVPSYCHTEGFHCSVNLLRSEYSSLPSPWSLASLIFLLSPQFCLFQKVI